MPAITLLRGARILPPEGPLVRADVLIDGGRIAGVAPTLTAPGSAGEVGLDGLILAPGFIDVHVHGGGGHSLITNDPAEITAYTHWAPKHGVTSFLATVCAGSPESAIPCAEAVAGVMSESSGAEVLGVNFEGPFVNPQRRGALPPGWLAEPDEALLGRLLDAAPVRIMTIAPELEAGLDLTRAAIAAGVRVSAGHTDASYDSAREAFRAGVSHVTHAFNAMRPLHHREPGPLAAAFEAAGVTVEVIADGVHLHPATVRLLIRTLGPDRVCLVTDATQAAGMDDGTFSLGGVEARIEDGAMRLPDGTIAGGVGTMDALVRNVMSWKAASVEDALRMASAVPARAAGVDNRKGRIATGFDADLVALTEDLRVQRTWTRGQAAH